jgi:hypothetical protein
VPFFPSSTTPASHPHGSLTSCSLTHRFPDQKTQIKSFIDNRLKQDEQIVTNVKSRIAQYYSAVRRSRDSRGSRVNVADPQRLSIEDIAFVLNHQLRKVPFFADCPQEFVNEVTRSFETRVYKTGDVIVSEFEEELEG